MMYWVLPLPLVNKVQGQPGKPRSLANDLTSVGQREERLKAMQLLKLPLKMESDNVPPMHSLSMRSIEHEECCLFSTQEAAIVCAFAKGKGRKRADR